jgi:16S rRNA (cytosine1402-N4)-methyltransferase
LDYSKHETVFREECVSFLTEKGPFAKDSLFADLTFGGGGHSKALLEVNESYRILAFDQDPEAIENGKEIISKLQNPDRMRLIHGNFQQFPKVYKSLVKDFKQGLQGIVMDLGVSSHHFDKPERGFSFRFDAPLDMRMNPQDEETLKASDVLNTFSKEDLEEIFRDYGEERFSSRIAEAIIEKRSKNPFLRTKDLEDVAFHCYPKKMRFKGVHPSTRCFQALRIFVNRELDVLRETVPQLVPLLNVGGRIAIISFHSLEDRIVKHQFKELAKSEIPCKILTKRPLVPSEKEIKNNSRSRSAKLRVLERISN